MFVSSGSSSMLMIIPALLACAPLGCLLDHELRQAIYGSLVCLRQDCGGEDYERWSPPTPNDCLMGRNITMERRRRSSDCFNGKEYERAETSSSPCHCTKVQSFEGPLTNSGMLQADKRAGMQACRECIRSCLETASSTLGCRLMWNVNMGLSVTRRSAGPSLG